MLTRVADFEGLDVKENASNVRLRLLCIPLKVKLTQKNNLKITCRLNRRANVYGMMCTFYALLFSLAFALLNQKIMQ